MIPNIDLLFKEFSNPLQGVFELFNKAEEVASEMDEKSSLPEVSLFSGLLNGKILEAVGKSSILKKSIDDLVSSQSLLGIGVSKSLAEVNLSDDMRNMPKSMFIQDQHKHKYESKKCSSKYKKKTKEKRKSESHLHGSVFSFSRKDRENNKLKTTMELNKKEKTDDELKNKDDSSSVMSKTPLEDLTKQYFDAEKMKTKNQSLSCAEKYPDASIPPDRVKIKVSEYNKSNTINTPPCTPESEKKLFSGSRAKIQDLKDGGIEIVNVKGGGVARDISRSFDVNSVSSLSLIDGLTDDIFSKKKNTLKNRGNMKGDSFTGQAGVENKINNLISVRQQKNKFESNYAPIRDSNINNSDSGMPNTESPVLGNNKMSQSNYEEFAEYLNLMLRQQASLRGVDLS